VTGDSVSAEGPTLEHLLRHEYGKLVSMLCDARGLSALADAQVTAERVLSAAQAKWTAAGVPERPQTWLAREAQLGDGVGAYDSLLRFMLACCHPELSRDRQLALTLKIACGFDGGAIARAQSIEEADVKSQLAGARSTIRERDIELSDLEGEALDTRLSALCQCLYAIHERGIAGLDVDPATRAELCHEAMRLGLFLNERLPGRAELGALMALMCLRNARAPDPGQGGIAELIFEEHDRAGLDRDLMQRGLKYLGDAASGRGVTTYHLEASIVAKHCMADSSPSTDWAGIQELYLQLVAIRPHPEVRLRLAFASSKVDGAAAGLAHLDGLRDDPRLADSPLLDAAFVQFYAALGADDDARRHLDRALQRLATEAQRALLSRRFRKLAR